jgi:enterochelin esterase-like enzyme
MIEWLTHCSKAIQGFPMGDPHERTFPVYLPPGYDAQRKEPYPVAFCLSGFSARSSHYIDDSSAYGISLPMRLDRAITEKRLRPLVVVFPDGVSRLGCSQYVNSPAFGNYMDYFCDELTLFIDEKYHTHRSPRFRGISGHSSGGFGALVTGFLRPDAFSFVGSSAGDTFFEASLLPLVTFAVGEIESAGGVAAFVKAFLEHPNPGSQPKEKFETMMLLAMAPCFAPNVKNAPLYGDVFFDLKTGTILREVWQKYMAWDPVHMVDKYADNAKRLSFIHLAAGLQDEHALQWGHRQLAEKLKALGIRHELEEYKGRHGGHHWRFESRFIKMTERMYGNEG